MKQARRRSALGVVAVIGLAGCLGRIPDTQFGQNTVQYDEFDFQILQTQHFDVYYYQEERQAAEQAARMAERWYARLSRLLNHELRGRQPLFLYASHPHFRQTTQIFQAPREGTGGVTEALKRRIVLPLSGPLRETDHVVGHELVHAFQFDMTQMQPGTLSPSNFPRALVLPLWFAEGMAEYLSLGPEDPHTAMWMRDAADHDRLPTMRQLQNPRFFPYRYGQAFWAYIAGRFGDEVVGRILNAGARTGNAEAALQRVLGIPVDSLNAEWREAVRTVYGEVREATDDAEAYGRLVLSRREDGSGLNHAPMLSPDGDELVFLSIRDFFSLDLFRADANTGEVLNRLVQSQSDPHFESIQFIRSAGAWSPDGTRFVVGAVTGSDPTLTILDVRNGNKVRERVFEDLGEIFNPSWSPDGNRIAFAALDGGLSDLFVYNLETDGLQRLTEDVFADIHPSWSPDGRTIAFSTDRFAGDASRLAYGNYRLAVVDPVTRRIEALPSFPRGKNINPHWAPDGASIYFLANPEGITNVYRMDVVTHAMFRVTNLYTGASGITALSPALTTSLRSDRIAFSVYEDGDYNVYVVEDPEVLRGEAVGGGDEY